MPSPGTSDVAVVMITRNRRDEALRSLGHLTALPERPPVVLVDNGSTDGTAAAVARQFPLVEVIDAGGNRGAATGSTPIPVVDGPPTVVPTGGRSVCWSAICSNKWEG